MLYLSTQDIVEIHEQILDAHEFQGLETDKPIEVIIARIDNRLHYGMISDAFELAACYACYIAVGHAFNDGSKRTAFATMDVSLTLNGIELSYDIEEVGAKIIFVAQSVIDEVELADWLKSLAG